jgi:DNA topoisomerase I
MNLLIVESPAKCKKIASFLGPSYRVLATMGHIRALDEDLDAVGIDRDFEPRFKFIKEKTKSMKAILEAAAEAKTVYLAADDDREGEAIAYSVACLLKKDPLSFPRAVFHEITETAIRTAVANPRKIDLNKVYAQQARSVLDMLVGFTISPLLWKHVGRGLSAGRCQTPALRLVYDKEKGIKSHTIQTSWIVKGQFPFEAKMDDELEDQESALNYLENIHLTQSAVVASATVTPWTANPPKPLITSTLQQEASALYKMNPKSTMKIAQGLYEAGHITYMRTDFAVLSEEAIAEAKEWVKEAHGAAYVGSSGQVEKAIATAKPKAKAKKLEATATTQNAQEAHEAIRPTHFSTEELPGDWTPQDKKIYALIWKRAVQSIMAPAKGQTLTVKLIFAGDKDFPWTAKWKKTDFPGWQILGMPADLDSEEEEAVSDWKQGMALKVGAAIEWSSIQAAPKRSKASPRFTEATLIRDLEKKGIGRPSTFASLVEVLFEKGYVEKKDITGEKATYTTMNITQGKWPPITQSTQISLGAEKQKLVPTALGASVVEFCIKEFPQLFAYDFTAQMENRLDSISQGKEPWKALCHNTWDSYKEDYKRLGSSASVPSASEKVKDFGNGFKAVMSKSGPLLVQEGEGENKKATFYSFPPDKTVVDITEQEARDWLAQLAEASNMGQFDGEMIVKKKGPYGPFLECKGIRIPYAEDDTAEQITVKFTEASSANEKKVTLGPYRFAVGKYGPYMYKDLVKKVFVSIPASIDVKKLTEAEAGALYKAGIEAKKNTYQSAEGRGGRGGRGRGGRGGRGRGGGGTS